MTSLSPAVAVDPVSSALRIVVRLVLRRAEAPPRAALSEPPPRPPGAPGGEHLCLSGEAISDELPLFDAQPLSAGLDANSMKAVGRLIEQ